MTASSSWSGRTSIINNLWKISLIGLCAALSPQTPFLTSRTDSWMTASRFSAGFSSTIQAVSASVTRKSLGRPSLHYSLKSELPRSSSTTISTPVHSVGWRRSWASPSWTIVDKHPSVLHQFRPLCPMSRRKDRDCFPTEISKFVSLSCPKILKRFLIFLCFYFLGKKYLCVENGPTVLICWSTAFGMDKWFNFSYFYIYQVKNTTK